MGTVTTTTPYNKDNYKYSLCKRIAHCTGSKLDLDLKKDCSVCLSLPLLKVWPGGRWSPCMRWQVPWQLTACAMAIQRWSTPSSTAWASLSARVLRRGWRGEAAGWGMLSALGDECKAACVSSAVTVEGGLKAVDVWSVATELALALAVRNKITSFGKNGDGTN